MSILTILCFTNLYLIGLCPFEVLFTTDNEFGWNIDESLRTLSFSDSQIQFINPDMKLWYINREKFTPENVVPKQVEKIESALEVACERTYWYCLTSKNNLFRFKNIIKAGKDLNSKPLRKVNSKDNKVITFECGLDYTIMFMENNTLQITGERVKDLSTEQCIIRTLSDDIKVLKIFCGLGSFWILCNNGKLGYCIINNNSFKFKFIVESSNIKKIVPSNHFFDREEYYILLDDYSLYLLTMDSLKFYGVRKVRDNVFDFVAFSDKNLIINSDDNSFEIERTSHSLISSEEIDFVEEKISCRKIISAFTDYYFIVDNNGTLRVFGRYVSNLEFTIPAMTDKNSQVISENFIKIRLPQSRAKSAKK